MGIREISLDSIELDNPQEGNHGQMPPQPQGDPLQIAIQRGFTAEEISSVLRQKGMGDTEIHSLFRSSNIPFPAQKLQVSPVQDQPVPTQAEPQQASPNLIKSIPVEQSAPEINSSGYFQAAPQDSPIDRGMKYAANITNIPQHMSNIASGLYNVSEGLVRGVSDIGSKLLDESRRNLESLAQPMNVIMYDNQKKAYYIPREQEQSALQQGYTKTLGPSVPFHED